jgi:hypothetical protein
MRFSHPGLETSNAESVFGLEAGLIPAKQKLLSNLQTFQVTQKRCFSSQLLYPNIKPCFTAGKSINNV